ncbi:MAG: alkaline phosphatase family protein [Planctomycetota bacterium]|nr:MAG: alkaline phosphatase family protein [Planctomycetota bacterium]
MPGLRPGDLDRHTTPTLYEWASAGVSAALRPTFPCVTSPVQASMWTGVPPGSHGVIANGFFDRERSAVAFWVAGHDVVEGEAVWDALHRIDAGLTSAVWHGQNIKGAGADYLVTPAPIHKPDGTTELWCYSKPEDLYPRLLDALGHFPLQHYWGPAANLESTRWILRGALWLMREHGPRLNWIYVPHLDYAGQKSGPDSEEARAALMELDGALAAFRAELDALGKDTAVLITGEYAMTNVRGAVYPNRILREAGWLSVREEDAAEWLDLPNSRAFAMADHQFAHVYVREPRLVEAVAERFRAVPGIARVLAGGERKEAGLDHPRSGEVILIADESRWLAYPWWFEDAAAPPFARTVDIHRKPGYDPLEMFLDPAGGGISLDTDLIRGSHGVPATGPHHHAALICSVPTGAVEAGRVYADTDVKGIVLRLVQSGTEGRKR